MKKVDQSIVCSEDGDCQRAVIASVLELPLEEVPHFIREGDLWALRLMDFMAEQGYPDIHWDAPESYPFRGHTFRGIMEYDGGWDGFFPASVPSQTFPDRFHAVVVDMDLKVVHDPNPNRRALSCKPEDVRDIITKGGWSMDLDGNLIRG